MIRQRTGRLGQADGLGLIGTGDAGLPGMQSPVVAAWDQSPPRGESGRPGAVVRPARGGARARHERDGDRAGDESSGPVGESPTVIPAEAAPATLALSGSRPW